MKARGVTLSVLVWQQDLVNWDTISQGIIQWPGQVLVLSNCFSNTNRIYKNFIIDLFLIFSSSNL